MNLVEPGTTVSAWDTYLNVSPSSSSAFPEAPKSIIRRIVPGLIAMDLTGVQPMSGECGSLFAMRYSSKMMVKSFSHMADQYLPPVD